MLSIIQIILYPKYTKHKLLSYTQYIIYNILYTNYTKYNVSYDREWQHLPQKLKI